MAIFKTENTRQWILARMWRNCTVWMRTQSDARLCEKYKRFSKNENWNYTWTSSPFPEYFSRRVEISIWKRFSSCAHCGSAHSCRGVETTQLSITSEPAEKLLSLRTMEHYLPFQKREALLTNFYASVHCSLCTPYSRVHIVFSCIEQLQHMQQILTGSLFIFIVTNVFKFSLLWHLRHTHHLKDTPII